MTPAAGAGLALRTVATWGGRAGRVPRMFTTAVLTADPTRVFVLGATAEAGALQTLDATTGKTLREHPLPALLCAGPTVVVSPSDDDGAVCVATALGEGSRLHALRLHDGAIAPLAELPWRVERLTRAGGRLFADGVLVEAAGPIDHPSRPRWYSRDLRWCVAEDLPSEPGEQVRVWRVEVATGTHALLGWRSPAADGAFSDDGRLFWRVESADPHGIVARAECWSLPAGAVAWSREVTYGTRILAIPEHPERPLTISGDGVLNDPTQAQAVVAAGGRWIGRSAGVSPDHRRAAWVCRGVVHVMDLTTGVDVTPCDGHAEPVIALAFSPSGALVASGAEREIVIRTRSDGAVQWRLEAPDLVEQVVFSADERSLLAVVQHGPPTEPVGLRSTIRTWSLTDGTELTPEPAHVFQGLVRLALAPDGARALVTVYGLRGVGPAWLNLADASLRSLSDDLARTPRPPQPTRGFASLGSFSEDGSRVWLLFREFTGGPWFRAELDGRDGRVLSCEPWHGPTPSGDARDARAGRIAFCAAADGILTVTECPLDAPDDVERWRVPAQSSDAVAVGPTCGAVATRAGEVFVALTQPAIRILRSSATGLHVTALALSRDERHLLAGHLDGSLRLLAWSAD